MNYRVGIRIARERAGLTQQQIAKRIGRHQSSISMVESGRRPATIEMVEQVAAAVGVSALAVYLWSTTTDDVPPRPLGVALMGRVASLVDALWRARRNGNRH